MSPEQRAILEAAYTLTLATRARESVEFMARPFNGDDAHQRIKAQARESEALIALLSAVEAEMRGRVEPPKEWITHTSKIAPDIMERRRIEVRSQLQRLSDPTYERIKQAAMRLTQGGT